MDAVVPVGGVAAVPAPAAQTAPTPQPAPAAAPALGATVPAPGTPAPGTPAPGTALPGGNGLLPTPKPCPTPAPADAGADTSAAVLHNWGTPNRVDEFNGTSLNKDWGVYDGPGHDGQGIRSPGAFSVKDSILTVTGTSDGTTGGMAWGSGQRYGRWEGRVRAPASDPTYHALLLLWPDAENWPVGGEVDFMEMSDPARQNTDMFLHYGSDNQQVQGNVNVDATQWHNWAVEWTPAHIVAYVDGKEWWHTNDTSILPPGPMHMTIQLDWFPGDGGKNVKQSQMQVDWVKQYPLTATQVAEGTADHAKRLAQDTTAKALQDAGITGQSAPGASAGPTSAGPTSAGPTSAGPTSTGPTAPPAGTTTDSGSLTGGGGQTWGSLTSGSGSGSGSGSATTTAVTEGAPDSIQPSPAAAPRTAGAAVPGTGAGLLAGP